MWLPQPDICVTLNYKILCITIISYLLHRNPLFGKYLIHIFDSQNNTSKSNGPQINNEKLLHRYSKTRWKHYEHRSQMTHYNTTKPVREYQLLLKTSKIGVIFCHRFHRTCTKRNRLQFSSTFSLNKFNLLICLTKYLYKRDIKALINHTANIYHTYQTVKMQL
jgi:hypothetical protein